MALAELYAPDVDQDFDWAAMIVDATVYELILLFVLYWLPVAIFAKSSARPSRKSLYFLAGGVAFTLVYSLNSYFFWLPWTCMETPSLHVGFQILRVYECPSSEKFINIIVWTPALLALIGAALGIRTLRSASIGT